MAGQTDQVPCRAAARNEFPPRMRTHLLALAGTVFRPCPGTFFCWARVCCGSGSCATSFTRVRSARHLSAWRSRAGTTEISWAPVGLAHRALLICSKTSTTSLVRRW